MSDTNIVNEVLYLNTDAGFAAPDWQDRMNAVNQQVREILINEIDNAPAGKYPDDFKDTVLEGFTVQSVTLDNGRTYVHVGLNDGTGFVLDDQNGIVRPSEQPEIIEQIFAEPEQEQSHNFGTLLANIGFTPLDLPCQHCDHEFVSPQAVGEKVSPERGIA